MNWYVAKLIYQIICGEGNHTPQFDEQVRLVTAPDEAAALRKAYRIGYQEEDLFRNLRHEPVHWKFLYVTELYALDEPVDGAEIYSRITEADDAAAHIHHLAQRAAALQERMPEACYA